MQTPVSSTPRRRGLSRAGRGGSQPACRSPAGLGRLPAGSDNSPHPSERPTVASWTLDTPPFREYVFSGCQFRRHGRVGSQPPYQRNGDDGATRPAFSIVFPNTGSTLNTYFREARPVAPRRRASFAEASQGLANLVTYANANLAALGLGAGDMGTA